MSMIAERVTCRKCNKSYEPVCSCVSGMSDQSSYWLEGASLHYEPTIKSLRAENERLLEVMSIACSKLGTFYVDPKKYKRNNIEIRRYMLEHLALSRRAKALTPERSE